MKRTMEFVSDTLEGRNRARRNKYESPIIKWFQANISPEKTMEIDSDQSEKFVSLGLKKTKEEETGVNHTFWEDDGGDRENLSASAYDDFLAQNSIDVSNANSVDFDALLNENQSSMGDYAEGESADNIENTQSGGQDDLFSGDEGFDTSGVDAGADFDGSDVNPGEM